MRARPYRFKAATSPPAETESAARIPHVAPAATAKMSANPPTDTRAVRMRGSSAGPRAGRGAGGSPRVIGFLVVTVGR